VLAACGGAASKVAAGQVAAASSSATVLEATNATYGTILTDSRGLTLYTYTADEPGGPGCAGSCLVLWPPLLLPPGVRTPTAGPGVAGLGTYARSGGLQVTYHGLPLYTYLDDVRPGLVSGRDIVDNGGTWLLATVPPSGAAPPAPTTSRAPAQTTVTRPGAQPTRPAVTRPGQPATTAPAARPTTAPPTTAPPTTAPPTTTTPATMAPPTTPPPTAPPGGGVSY